MRLTKENIIKQLNEWIVKFKDKEYEKKLDPAWKKSHPNKDAINYRLPGSFK